jgi:hypothetical protein
MDGDFRGLRSLIRVLEWVPVFYYFSDLAKRYSKCKTLSTMTGASEVSAEHSSDHVHKGKENWKGN